MVKNIPAEYKILITEGPRKLTFYTKPFPDVCENEVAIETLYSGISHGTEMNVYRGLAPHFKNEFNRSTRLFVPYEEVDSLKIPERGYFISRDYRWHYPFAYGYSNVGEVIHVGKDVSGFSPGDLVYTYRQHATHLVQPADQVFKLPPLKRPETGIFVANTNTALSGVMDSNIKLGDFVVIFGQGVVGLLVTQWVSKAGAYKIITVDKLPDRRKLSLEMGADLSLDPDGVDVAQFLRGMTGDRGADVVFEVSGNYSALHQAIRTAAPNTQVIAMGYYSGDASVINLGAEFHHNRIIIKSSLVDIIGPDLSATHSVRRRIKLVCESLPTMNLESIISDMIPFEDAIKAYEMIDRHPDRLTQVVLCYD